MSNFQKMLEIQSVMNRVGASASHSLINLMEVAKALPVIAFKPQWAGATGYFEPLVNRDEGTDPFTFDDPTGRLAIVIPTAGGNIIVFQRYSQQTVVCNNVPDVVRGITGALSSYDNLYTLLCIIPGIIDACHHEFTKLKYQVNPEA